MKTPSPASSSNQFFDPSAEDKALFAKHAAGGNGKGGMGAAGSEVSLEQLLKVSDEPKVTKEEENTFIMQVRWKPEMLLIGVIILCNVRIYACNVNEKHLTR